jgi:hypothetical protein
MQKKKKERREKVEQEGYKPNTLLERNIARFSREQEDEWRRQGRMEKEKQANKK